MLNDILVNDVVNQLQADEFRILWKRCKSSQCYYSLEMVDVIIGNDIYKVTGLKSYETIVGFIHNGVMYECGKYSSTTSKQFTRYFAKLPMVQTRVYVDKMYM